MARADFQTLPGTRDLTEPESGRTRRLVQIFASEADRAGFGQIVPPMFEDVGVFVRLGEASDVVSKELYSFTDKGGRDIALRPEFTASVCRSFAEQRPFFHGRPGTPVQTSATTNRRRAGIDSSIRSEPRSSGQTIQMSTPS